MQLKTGKNLLEGPNADSVHKMKTRSSERESTPASPNAEEHTAHGTTDISNIEACIPQKTLPVASETISSSKAAVGDLNVDIPAMKIDHENLAKRKAMKHTETEPHDLAMVSDDFNASCKKQKRLAALDVEIGSNDEIHIQECNSSAKGSHLDVGLNKENELQIPTNTGSTSYDELGDIVRNEQEDNMEILELKQFSKSIGQIERASSSSEWKLMEKELYLKGLEIFGRNR